MSVTLLWKCLCAAAHRGRPDRLLVHVHALLALQTGGQLLVCAVGNLLDQLQTLLHLTGRKDTTLSDWQHAHICSATACTHNVSFGEIHIGCDRHEHPDASSLELKQRLINKYRFSRCLSELFMHQNKVLLSWWHRSLPVSLKCLSFLY